MNESATSREGMMMESEAATSRDEAEAADELLAKLAELIECADPTVESLSARLIEIMREAAENKKIVEDACEELGCEADMIADEIGTLRDVADMGVATVELLEAMQDALGLSNVSMHVLREASDKPGAIARELRLRSGTTESGAPGTDSCRMLVSMLVKGLSGRSNDGTSIGQAQLRSV